MKNIILSVATFLFATLSSAQVSWTIENPPTTVASGEVLNLTIAYSGDASDVFGDEFTLFNLREITPEGVFVGELGIAVTGNETDNGPQSGTYMVTYTVPDPIPALSDPANSYAIGGYTTANEKASFAIAGNFPVEVTGNVGGVPPSITLDNAAAIGTEFFQGQIITLELSYTGATEGDNIQIGLNNTAGDEANQFAFPIIDAQGGAIPDGSISFDYTVPGDILAAGVESEGDNVLVIFSNGMSANVTGVTIFADEATLSTDDFSTENISSQVFPNPTTGQLNFSNIKTETYAVYNLSGALIKEKEADGVLDISDLPVGLYLVATDQGVAKISKQ